MKKYINWTDGQRLFMTDSWQPSSITEVNVLDADAFKSRLEKVNEEMGPSLSLYYLDSQLYKAKKEGILLCQ